ncbi:MAG: flavin reductase family protein [Firmicutes bacterium]|nr:flavin reductase family protein [Bacillota bacterium]
MKIEKPGSTALQPVPVVLVTSVDDQNRPNIITIAWAGTVCSEPPMVGIGIRPSRYSHGLIKKNRQFVINLPTQSLLRVTDYCGVVSGRDVDKFAATGLTPRPASKVAPPLIEECPVNLECEVRQVLELGSHDLFLAEVLAVHIDESALDPRGRIDNERFNPVAYNGQIDYLGVGAPTGSYGFSAKK